MVMNPRTHPRGKAPDFELPKPNPNPERMTDALWWLVCMREALEPASQNGGTLALKPGYHSYGSRLPDHGAGNSKTDHSIRRGPDREGPWWRSKTSAHDWTFPDAQRGDFTTIKKYSNRLRNAMRDPKDLRPDNVYAYFIGQIDNDRVVEGYNEYQDSEESGDTSHLWHRHDSFRRNVIGIYWAMWKALTIDMGWTYAEWLESTQPVPTPAAPAEEIDVAFQDEKIKVTETMGRELFEPDLAAGTEINASTALQLAAIHARRAALATDTLEGRMDKTEADLEEVKGTLAEIKALLAGDGSESA